MRDRRLQTIDEDAVVREAVERARHIDTFLGSREVSVLQKLVAVGGAVEQESFEVQVKARLEDDAHVLQVLQGRELTVIRRSRYRQHDIYWSFDDAEQGRLRYRDDEFLDDGGEVTGERSRLTLTGHTREDRFGAVLLFRSRYLAPAAHSARFYREYFRPAAEHLVTKERRRWLVAYRGVEFYVHLDRLIEPAVTGFFLEVKSRTWSQRDARDKAAIIAELLALFGATPDTTLGDGYVELARGGGS
jgi:5-methylthioadenosine/S-adenosylhomocysteine deaminase